MVSSVFLDPARSEVSTNGGALDRSRSTMDQNQESQLSEAGESRRRALKAGVAVGVGAMAWSGPTITSLGGTPAYAAVCTQVATLNVDLIKETNTNLSCSVGTFKFLTFQANLNVSVPAKYNLNVSDVLGKCASTGRTITFTNPPGEKCKLTFKICNNNAVLLTGPLAPAPPSTCYSVSSTNGTLTLPSLTGAAPPTNQESPTAGLRLQSNGRYGLSLVCVPTNAQCYPDGIDF